MDFEDDLTKLTDDELTAYADQLTAEIEKVQDEAHRVGAERNERLEKQNWSLANRPKTEEEKALDRKYGSGVDE